MQLEFDGTVVVLRWICKKFSGSRFYAVVTSILSSRLVMVRAFDALAGGWCRPRRNLVTFLEQHFWFAFAVEKEVRPQSVLEEGESAGRFISTRTSREYCQAVEKCKVSLEPFFLSHDPRLHHPTTCSLTSRAETRVAWKFSQQVHFVS